MIALLWAGCGDEPGAGPASASDAAGAAEDLGPAEPTLSYEGLIQPILATWCGDCHTGPSQSCPGDTCFVTHYEDLLLPSETCDGFNKAKCGLKRIKASADPNDSFNLVGKNGPIILPQAEIDLLDEWIWDLGMPEK